MKNLLTEIWAGVRSSLAVALLIVIPLSIKENVSGCSEVMLHATVQKTIESLRNPKTLTLTVFRVDTEDCAQPTARL